MIEPQPDRELTRHDADRIVESWLGESASCTAITKLAGGMVNTVYRLEFDAEPHAAVVKLHGRRHASFEREAQALDHLATTGDCPVPQVYAHDSSATLVPHAYLLLEHVAGSCLDSLEVTDADQDAIDVELARVLAGLHRHSRNGWGPVDDPAVRTWPELVGERLAQVRTYPALAERLSIELIDRLDRLVELAPELLGDGSTVGLVHGDVWAGNTIVRRIGTAWEIAALLDPDAQYADPEHELAYLEVFDARRDVFFETYRRYADIRPGYHNRRLVYWLHTALLHVALFDNPFFVDYTERIVGRLEQLA